MPNKPFFSILIPVYNAENTVVHCVQSILSQSDGDVEIVLLDDGSKDGSASVCRKLAECYPDRVRFSSRENRGALLTRHELLQSARGEWIWFIDADDEIAENALDTLRSLIEANDADMILFDCLERHPGLQDVQMAQFPGTKGDLRFDKQNPDDALRLYEAAVRGDLNSLWNKVFRLSCADLDTDYAAFGNVRKGNDRMQAFPLLTNAQKLLYKPLPLYIYNCGDTGLTATFGTHTKESLRTGLAFVEGYTRRWQLESELRPMLALLRTRNVYQLLTQFVLGQKQQPTYKAFRSYFEEITGDEAFMKDYDTVPMALVDSYARPVTQAVCKRKPLRCMGVIILRNRLHRLKALIK